jgi:hypothetical protein
MTKVIEMRGIDIEYYTEEWVCNDLGITKSTMQARRSRGVNHPPFKKFSRTEVRFPKKEYHEWLKQIPLQKEIKGVMKAI